MQLFFGPLRLLLLPRRLVLCECLLVDDYVLMCLYYRLPASYGQPLDGVLVEEGPRRDDGEEGQGCSGKANLESEGDVLCEETNEEGDGLKKS